MNHIARTAEDFIAQEQALGAMNYKPLDVVLARGEGVYVWDRTRMLEYTEDAIRDALKALERGLPQMFADSEILPLDIGLATARKANAILLRFVRHNFNDHGDGPACMEYFASGVFNGFARHDLRSNG